MPPTLKIHDWIIFILLAILTMFGVLSYFFSPKDPENAKVIIACFIGGIGMVLAFKFGVHVATPPPGSLSLVQTSTPPAPPVIEALPKEIPD